MQPTEQFCQFCQFLRVIAIKRKILWAFKKEKYIFSPLRLATKTLYPCVPALNFIEPKLGNYSVVAVQKSPNKKQYKKIFGETDILGLQLTALEYNKDVLLYRQHLKKNILLLSIL